ncbi:MAG: DUF1292 domain-containing protein [Christensenellaceae bacterium]|nr:DUF1292 domain-containing protein [Christensenellaceae bacterium]
MANNIVEYTDDNGVKKEYEMMMNFKAAGNDYVLLLPVDETDDNALIMRVMQGEQASLLLPIETAEENQAVMEAYAAIMGE